MSYFYIQNRRYLGNKFKLIKNIEKIIINKKIKFNSFLDLFSGTGVVANHFNSLDKKIITNDILESNRIITSAYLESKKKPKNIIKKIEYLNSLKDNKENYFSDNYGNKYFSFKNACKIGLIRDKIEDLVDSEAEKNILLTSLIYALDKVANTVGHYDAYRETKIDHKSIVLKEPFINYSKNYSNKVYCLDSNQLVKKIKKVDIAYIDPPYNSRQYSDCYHLLENLVHWEKPKVFGKAKKMDRSHIKSKYCGKNAALEFEDLILKLKAKYIIVSYNNTENTKHGRSNAKITFEQIKNTLLKKGKIEINKIDFKAFTSGKSRTLNHKEILFYCKVK
jgi:adenine-specific DNA-methyltransferase